MFYTSKHPVTYVLDFLLLMGDGDGDGNTSRMTVLMWLSLDIVEPDTTGHANFEYLIYVERLDNLDRAFRQQAHNSRR